MGNFKHVSLPVHRDKASAKVYDANGKYLFWITLAGESIALDDLREKGESWLDFRNRTQPMRDAIAVEELSIADFMVEAINAFDAAKDAEIARLREAKDLIADWIIEGTEDLPDDTPVTIKIGNRSTILDELKNLRAAAGETPHA